MGDRYIVRPNEAFNVNVYPWSVVDTQVQGVVAMTVTEHTAQSYCGQLNEKGYIESV